MKNAFRKLFLFLMALTLGVSLTACQKENEDTNKVSDFNFESAYAIVTEFGFTGTLDDFIAAFNGDKAYTVTAAKGYSGSETEWLLTLASATTTNDVPYIGLNDNWFVGGIDTGVCARGKNGESAYEIFVRLNSWYNGSEEEWMNDLVNGRLVRFTVEFDSMDGSEIAEIANIQKGDKLTPPSSPIKNDYVFAGWFKENACINEWIFANDKVTENIILYAKWTPVYFTYTDADEGCELTGLTALGEEWFISNTLEIPASIDGKTVIGIKDFALQLKAFSGVKIPNSIKYIGKNSFYGNENLETVSFESNSQLTKIGQSAFGNCKKLKSIEIPDSVTNIGNTAFMDCAELERISLGSGLTEIGSAAFGYTKITEIIIPKNIQKLSSTFGACRSLEKVIFESGSQLTSLLGTFIQCQSLKEIELPDSLIEIGANTFNHCSSLENINIPAGVTSIGSNAFNNCSILAEINIPNSVISIGNNAFYNCNALANIVLPDNLTSIGNQTFQNCTSLIEINIPDNVTSIGIYAFANCSALESIILPSNLTSIGSYAFQNCSSLINVIIPEGVTSIDNYTFSNCSALKSIILPSNLTSIGLGAFKACNALDNIYFGADKATTLSVTIDADNTPLIVANVYFYSETSISDGKHWHFNGILPEIWA